MRWSNWLLPVLARNADGFADGTCYGMFGRNLAAVKEIAFLRDRRVFCSCFVPAAMLLISLWCQLAPKTRPPRRVFVSGFESVADLRSEGRPPWTAPLLRALMAAAAEDMHG
ncbi:hypothetical protein [Mesorhizobium sp. M0207]|uniref:hypothetical protein n=1 Tax=unclassified Mesorhizobium TaxID=325217 RepID=UPI00333DED5C